MVTTKPVLRGFKAEITKVEQFQEYGFILFNDIDWRDPQHSLSQLPFFNHYS